METQSDRQLARLRWFQEARFGMFIHWGLYSHIGRGEWVRYQEAIPSEEYTNLALQFNPRNFDANGWAQLAKAAGMRYMVLTAKHHDGFCLFDSQHTDFTAPRTASQRDFVAEYVSACRKAGLGVGLYFSVKDWSFPAYFEGPEQNPTGWNALVDHVHRQVEELLTNYGKIDILWYDGPDDANFRGGWGDRTKHMWRAEELNVMVHQLQPDILTNNRFGLSGDFSTPEQEIPAAFSGEVLFESCVTMDNSWGYYPNGSEYKSVKQLLGQLVSCAARGGNYLLNVGPDSDGLIPQPAVSRLLSIGDWLKIHGEAIYGTERVLPNWWDYTSTGRITTKGTTAYVIVQNWPSSNQIVLSQLRNAVDSAVLLGNGQELSVKRDGRRLIVQGLPTTPPSMPLNIIKLELVGQPEAQYYY